MPGNTSDKNVDHGGNIVGNRKRHETSNSTYMCKGIWHARNKGQLVLLMGVVLYGAILVNNKQFGSASHMTC